MTGRAAHLALADGTLFPGRAFGADASVTGEVVFTTGMTGYQEVLTDPSYCGQIVTMTAPEMGNVGVNSDDLECQKSWVAGFGGVDTRALTRHIRDHGAQMAAIGTQSVEALLAQAKAAPDMNGRDLT